MAEVNRAGTAWRYTLHYRAMEGVVLQSHIHIGSGGRLTAASSCSSAANLGNGTPDVPPPCPASPAKGLGRAHGR